MRYVFGVLCICALGVMPLVGCSETAGTGGTGGDGGAGGSAGRGGEGGDGGSGGMAGFGGEGGGGTGGGTMNATLEVLELRVGKRRRRKCDCWL